VETQKYQFKMIQCDGTKIVLNGHRETLEDVMEDFKQFLAGCGYGQSTIDKYFE
jgi:hypothetical protein